MTPTLNSPEGLTIDTGEVSTNIPALTLQQTVNDEGDAKFAVLQLEGSTITDNEQFAFIRAYHKGVEVFSVSPGGVIGASANFQQSVTAGFSTLSTDTLNLASQVFLTAETSNVLALRRGQNAQTLKIYNSLNTDNGNAERLSIGWDSSTARIKTEKVAGGLNRDLILGAGGVDLISIGASNQLAFFGATPVYRPTFGVATAGVSYTSNEQSMLNKVYSALRTLGLAS